MTGYNKLYSKLILVFTFLFALLSSGLVAARLDAPSNLTGTIDGAKVTINWNHVSGAQGYNVYINNNYTTTTVENEYTTSIDKNELTNFYVTAFTKNPTEFSRRSDQLSLPESVQPVDLTIPPSVPTDLRGEVNGTTVSISWSPSTDDEAVAGYNVYRNNQYISTVFETRYEGLIDAGESVTFAVVAFDTRINFSTSSQKLSLPDAETTPETETDISPETTPDDTPVETGIPPSVPTGLSGTITENDAKHAVSLRWNAAVDDQAVKGYNVYENGSYKTTVFETSFSTDISADTTYAYYVVAFDFDGNFSNKTSPIRLPDALEPTIDTEIPSSPSNLIGNWEPMGDKAEITLQWTPATDNVGIAGYNIYENKRYLTTVNTHSFTTTVNADASYSYRIVAFDIARNFSKPSFSQSFPDGENQAPVFEDLADITAFAGETVEIRIKPVDNDGETPGLFIGTLPTGMQSIDNFDGTRTLRWRPLQPDVGDYDITVTAFDSADASLQTVRTFTLTLQLPEDESSIRNEPPDIDGISEQITRIGDTVIMPVKATDPNGTVPVLTMKNLPENASFQTHPDEPNIKVLRWTTSPADEGANTLVFRAEDAIDPNLNITSEITVNVVKPSQFERNGERLKALANKHDLLIGYASLLNFSERPDTDLYKATAAAEFNLVTAENSMKWAYINPEPDEYRFEAADALVEFAAQENMTLHGHTLVWYSALPQWVQTSRLSERESIMNDFIDTMTSRYNSVAIWDVVNEAFEDDGSYRNSVWFQAMGKAHIAKAFRRARIGAPNATLIYNDYDIAAGGAKTDATFALLESLIADNAPLDGIGFQMHLEADFTDFGDVANTFQRFANLGIEIYITELDVAQVPGTDEQDQARVYKNVMQTCLAQSACKALQVWGVTDRYTWLRGDTPLLFDRHYQPKPAYQALQQALSE